MRCRVGEACVGVRGKLHVESIGCRMMNQSHDEAGRRNAAGFLVQIEVVRSPSYAGAGRKSPRADEGWCVEDATGEDAAWRCGLRCPRWMSEVTSRRGMPHGQWRCHGDVTSLTTEYMRKWAQKSACPLYSPNITSQAEGDLRDVTRLVAYKKVASCLNFRYYCFSLVEAVASMGMKGVVV